MTHTGSTVITHPATQPPHQDIIEQKELPLLQPLPTRLPEHALPDEDPPRNQQRLQSHLNIIQAPSLPSSHLSSSESILYLGDFLHIEARLGQRGLRLEVNKYYPLNSGATRGRLTSDRRFKSVETAVARRLNRLAIFLCLSKQLHRPRPLPPLTTPLLQVTHT